jgi:hypothetical protein
MWVGFVLICIGILVLLSNMDIIRGNVWNYIWPLILVIFGISLILKRGGHGRWHHDRHDHHAGPSEHPNQPGA